MGAASWDTNAGGGAAMRFGKEVLAYFGEIPANQEEILEHAHFIGGDGEEEEEEDDEVFSTPPGSPRDPPQGQGQGLRRRAAGGEVEEVITMCSMPFTQTPPSPSPSPAASSPSSGSQPMRPQKPRRCTRKVRASTKIWPPSPTPTPPAPAPAPAPARAPTPSHSFEMDPLLRAVLMIPTVPLPDVGGMDILELARGRGIFN